MTDATKTPADPLTTQERDYIRQALAFGLPKGRPVQPSGTEARACPEPISKGGA